MALGNRRLYIQTSAIVWVAIILGTAVVLKDTGYWSKVMPLLGAPA